ncbi:MAG TPA: TadE/TadG family type IV pilus assembly protein [Actinomycetota bacterium]
MDAGGRPRRRPRGPIERTWLGRARDQRGAIAVEFALIVPLLLLLVLGILEFGFGYHAWDATQNAAREGARVGAVVSSQSEIEARVRGTTSFLDQSKLSVTCEVGSGGSFSTCGEGVWDEGDIVRVTVEYRYDFITPLPNFVGMGTQAQLKSISEARFEGE